MISDTSLATFIRESNRIEGILRDPYGNEIEALESFLKMGDLHIGDMSSLVGVFQPNAVLRDRPGLDVRVGSHIPRPGGIDVPQILDQILQDAMQLRSPYLVHQEYEYLHPYSDGNGRSGRALWAWIMHHRGGDPHWHKRGFLHTWYYQSLEYGQRRNNGDS